MQRVLVTGGAGYLGSVIVPALLAKGYGVRVLDSFRYRQSASLLDCCHDPNLEILRGDVRDRDRLAPALDGTDYVIHLAAVVGAPACDIDPEAATSINLEATRLLLSLRKGQRILFPCTNSGYGIGQEGIECTEETPLRPVSLYGRTKVEAERAILDSGNSVSLRLATVFGSSPRMRTDLLVNDFVQRAVRDRFVVVFEGHFKRNYIHIRDVARAFVHCMDNFDSMQGRPYNVGLTNANLSKLELCEAIKRRVPNFVYIESQVGKDPDKRDYIVSNARIEGTGFAPRLSVDDGIVELMKAYAILPRTAFENI